LTELFSVADKAAPTGRLFSRLAHSFGDFDHRSQVANQFDLPPVFHTSGD